MHVYLDVCVEVHGWIDGLPKPSCPPANSKLEMVAQHAVHVRATSGGARILQQGILYRKLLY